MIVKFNGSYGLKTSGCNCSGGRTTQKARINRKIYRLPSGVILHALRGRTYDLSENDVEFLMKYEYEDENGTHNEFEVIK